MPTALTLLLVSGNRANYTCPKQPENLSGTELVSIKNEVTDVTQPVISVTLHMLSGSLL
jgi:hypothetical protein